MAWERLNSTFESNSAPPLVKIVVKEESSQSKNKGSDAWNSALEDYRMKLEDMGSTMSIDLFIIQMLKFLIGYKKLQMAL